MNRLNKTLAVGLVLLSISALAICLAEERLRLGYAVCQTVKTVGAYPTPQEVLPGTVIRFLDSTKGREIFAISNKDGMVLVPLRPGKYCFEAYDKNGARYNLDPEQRDCFSVKQSEHVEIGVVVDGRKLPN